MAYATHEDVSELLGRDLDPAETAIVDRRLDHAEDLILSRIPDLPEKIQDNPTLGRLLAMVEIDAILRLIRNTGGYKAESDGQYRYRIDPKVASGRISILPDEWELLGVRGVTRIALSIRTGVVGRQEGDMNTHRPKSGPNTAPFETGLDTGAWA